LIAITAEAVDLNRTTDYGPKSACAGFVPQISRVIYGAGENALPRRFDEALAIWRPEAVRGSAHERFDPAHLGTRKTTDSKRQFRCLSESGAICACEGDKSSRGQERGVKSVNTVSRVMPASV